MNVKHKSDYDGVNAIINLAYPDNKPHLMELLSWTCDPNWPVAADIYVYFRELGEQGVSYVLGLNYGEDFDWKYNVIVQIIAAYDQASLALCKSWLIDTAKSSQAEDCDIEALRILAQHKLIEESELQKIVQQKIKFIKHSLQDLEDISEGKY